MQIECLIVDDEPLSQEVIVDFVNACPELNLLGVCNNAIEAGERLQREKIDLLFLDINMPTLSGIGFIKTLKNPPLFILVTAYPEHALAGFEIDAVDYLLKPVSFERFRIAVNRVLDRISAKSENQVGHLLLWANKKNYRVGFDEILYLEAQGDYVKFFTKNKNITVHGKMKDFIAQLPEKDFERIHKSYVISLSKVEYVEGNMVKVGDKKLPVSLTYKEHLLARLGK